MPEDRLQRTRDAYQVGIASHEHVWRPITVTGHIQMCSVCEEIQRVPRSVSVRLCMNCDAVMDGCRECRACGAINVEFEECLAMIPQKQA